MSLQNDFVIGRKEAAKLLWISTRSVDRRIRAGKLLYKKQWKKVLLSKSQIDSLVNEEKIDVVHSPSQVMMVKNTKKENVNVDSLVQLLKEKDKIIEEKNQMLIMVQQKIWQLEEKLKNSIALPDYTNEKEKLIFEKDKLETQNKALKEMLKKKQIEALFYLVILLFIVFSAIFLLLSY